MGCQMLESHHRILQYATITLGLIVAITIPDVIFDLSLGFLGFVFDHLLELGHIVFEMVESMLDKAVEHIFHTDLHQTQTIVFYVMLAGVVYLAYLVFNFLAPLGRRVIHHWIQRKNDCLEKWRGLSFGSKAVWISVFLAGLYLLSFLFF